MKLLIIAGARPNFIKIAPICNELDNIYSSCDYAIVHTGQHYDEKMSDSFFTDLEIPKPKYQLGVGSDTHARQVAMIMIKFEEVCNIENPDAIMVVGDVNSTMACSLVAAKMGVRIIHLEAGLRSFDKTMPEEINRIVTDSITDLYLTPSPDADQNLINEGVPKSKIFRVGNIMIDSLMQNLKKAQDTDILSRYGLKEKQYLLVTLHRPSNVDREESLKALMSLLVKLSKTIIIIFPLHPRTLLKLQQFKINYKGSKELLLIEPQNYLNFLHLQSKALLVITDSGGVQEETTVLNIPCITLRENTERPITISEGTNVLAGNNFELTERLVNEAFSNSWKKGSIPNLWDGKTAKRVVKEISRFLA